LIFKFQKYIQPIWYFNLNPQGGRRWINGLSNISGTINNSFEENITIWRSYFQGLGIQNEERIEGIKMNSNLLNNYSFVRQNFHPFWAWYILLIRIFTFHHPFREVYCFWKAMKTKKICLENGGQEVGTNVHYAEPIVSVIIPTLNRYTYLKDVLHDLEQQQYKIFEVIIVDQSDPFQPDFYPQFDLEIRLIRQKEKLLWRARNEAVRKAKGDLLLLFDDDSGIGKDWIIQHVHCLEKYDCQISSGVSISKVGDKIPENYDYFRLSDQLDTGNVMIKREVFEEVGLFDEQFEKQRMGDAEFGLRAYLQGFKNISNPLAKRIHLKVSEGGLREMGLWDAFRPRKLLSPRPIPSALYYSRKYFGDELSRYWLLKSVPPSLIPLNFKKNRILFALSFPLMLIASPLIIIQIIWSWRLSSSMLKEGPKISKLEKVTDYKL